VELKIRASVLASRDVSLTIRAGDVRGAGAHDIICITLN
jgi:hypothetical protein